MDNKSDGFFDDIIKFALIALLIVVPIRWFVAQPFVVKGASMEPTFENGEYLIVDQLSYHLGEPNRGDVIIMRYPKDPSVFFIKRIIGLPNETVEIQGKRVIIRHGAGTESLTLDESFIDPSRMRDEYATYVLGATDYFVMGDNRIESSDSRSWGLLPRKDVVGRALFRLFPLNRIDVNPGKESLPQ
jgi:signal peptidase I